MKAFAAIVILSLFYILAQAATVDLRPVSPDIQQEWSEAGSVCTEDVDEWNCVDDDVEANDGDTGVVQGLDTDAETEEFNVSNAPGDFGSTNSITAKMVIRQNSSNDEDDRVDFHLEDNGTQVGGTKCASENDTACTCNHSTAYTTCSFTDSAWDSLSESSIDALSIVITTVNNTSGMPDTSVFNVTAIELVLDYNLAGADTTVIQTILVGQNKARP